METETDDYISYMLKGYWQHIFIDVCMVLAPTLGYIVEVYSSLLYYQTPQKFCSYTLFPM